MQLFNLKAIDYVTPGGLPVFLNVSEADKTGTVVGYYMVTLWLPGGSAGITTSGSGYMHEIPSNKATFDALKALGWKTEEFKQVPDGGADALRNQYEAAIKMRDEASKRMDYATLGIAWQIIFGVKQQADAIGVDISFWYKPFGFVGGK